MPALILTEETQMHYHFLVVKFRHWTSTDALFIRYPPLCPTPQTPRFTNDTSQAAQAL